VGEEFVAKIADQFGWTLEHLKRTSDEPRFTVIPKRWVRELMLGLAIIAA
jgi:putative transposase